jgi:hypothetical protein
MMKGTPSLLAEVTARPSANILDLLAQPISLKEIARQCGCTYREVRELSRQNAGSGSSSGKAGHVRRKLLAGWTSEHIERLRETPTHVRGNFGMFLTWWTPLSLTKDLRSLDPTVISAYAKHLINRARRPDCICSGLYALMRAIKIAEPQQDWTWLTVQIQAITADLRANKNRHRFQQCAVHGNHRLKRGQLNGSLP